MRCATFYFPSQRIILATPVFASVDVVRNVQFIGGSALFVPARNILLLFPSCAVSAIWNILCDSPLDPTHEEQLILLFRPTKRSFPPSFSRLIFLWEMYASTYVYIFEGLLPAGNVLLFSW